MSVNYKIFGRTVQPHVLAIATLATVIGGVMLPGMLKGKSQPVSQTTPIAAPVAAAKPAEGEIDVEKSINDFLKSLETETEPATK